jgi:hypothetical protein
MQYNMQNEGPPQYADLAQKLDAFVKTGNSPYSFSDLYPDIKANYWAVPDAYATSIVQQHPIEFIMKTVPIFFSSLTQHYHESQVIAQGPFGNELVTLENLSQKSILLYQLFPLFALIWLVLLFWPRTARSRQVEMLAALSLIGLYELVLIATGGYEAYARLHTPFNPLMLVVICETLLLGLPLSAYLVKKSSFLTAALVRLWPVIWWVGGSILVACILASAILTLLHHGAAALGHLHMWSGFSLVFDSPVRSAIVVALLALLAYNVYQAHHLRTPSLCEESKSNHA